MQNLTSTLTTITDDHVYRLDLYFGPFVHSHQKLPQRCLMNYQVTDIEFDLDCDAADEELTPEDEKELYDEIIGSFWEAIDGDDLVEEITAATGWCIKSIDYRHVLN